MKITTHNRKQINADIFKCITSYVPSKKSQTKEGKTPFKNRRKWLLSSADKAAKG